MAISWPRPTDFVAGQPNHTSEHNLINEHLNALYQAIGTLPEGMTYDPDGVGLTMGDGNESSAVISPHYGFQAVGITEESHTQIGFAPDAWLAVRYPVDGGPASGFYLTSYGLVVVNAGMEMALGFPEGDSWTVLPEEGTEGAIHTLATREWVDAREVEGTLPEGMEYDPDTGELVMISPVWGAALISPQKIRTQSGGASVHISHHEIRTEEIDGGLGSGMSLTPQSWMSYIHDAETTSIFGLSLGGLTTFSDDVERTLLFPEGSSYTALPEEGTGSAPHTLATREWVASEGTLLESPNGSLFRLTVADDGTLSTTPVI